MTAKIRADYDLNRLVSEWGFKTRVYGWIFCFKGGEVLVHETGKIELWDIEDEIIDIPQIIIDMALAGVFEKGEER